MTGADEHDDLAAAPSGVTERAGASAAGDPGSSGDPLLAQAEALADLPLAERVAALGHLNAALVAELNALEEV